MSYECSTHGKFSKEEAEVVSGDSVSGEREVVQYQCPVCGEDMAYLVD